MQPAKRTERSHPAPIPAWRIRPAADDAQRRDQSDELANRRAPAPRRNAAQRTAPQRPRRGGRQTGFEMRGWRGEVRAPSPMPAPVPACANQMDSYLPRAYSHDRYMLLYTVINSTDQHVHQPPNPSKLSPSRPSPSPSRARMACARSHGRRALHTVLVAQACCNRPSIPVCCRLIVHPLSANESDITSQVSYANGLSDIAPPPSHQANTITPAPGGGGVATLVPPSKHNATMSLLPSRHHTRTTWRLGPAHHSHPSPQACRRDSGLPGVPLSGSVACRRLLPPLPGPRLESRSHHQLRTWLRWNGKTIFLPHAPTVRMAHFHGLDRRSVTPTWCVDCRFKGAAGPPGIDQFHPHPVSWPRRRRATPKQH